MGTSLLVGSPRISTPRRSQSGPWSDKISYLVQQQTMQKKNIWYFLMFRVLDGGCTLERDVALSWQLLTLTYLQLWPRRPRKYTKTKHWHWETIHRIFLLKIAAKSIFENLFMNPHCARRVSSNALFDLFRCQILQLMANDCRKKTIRSYTGSPSDFQQQVGWETRLIRSWLQTTPRFWSSLVC